jgi:hypothetical protein
MPVQLRALGVYWLEVTPEVFAAQLPMYGDEDQCRDHFSSIALIEIMVDSPNERFSLNSFTQPNHAYSRVSPQAPWDEGLLSLDGMVLLDRRINCAKKTGRVRLAFYMHYWVPGLPLLSSYGEVQCPSPQPMPERLKTIMPYRPCD